MPRISSLLTATVIVGVVAFSSPVSAHEDSSAHYVVQPNETLSHIALKTGVTVQELVDANGLTTAHLIRSGQTLDIPGGAVAATVDYTIQPGDTASEIAVRVGISTRELAEINGLTNVDRIRVGSVIQVPAGSVATVGTERYPNLPDRIVDNPERLALLGVFEHWAQANDLPVDLLMSVAWQESGWNNAAVSYKGAVGIGQIMPDTGVWVATDLIGRPELDPNNPEDNIRMSARFLRWLLDYTDDETLAVASYFQGPGSVSTGELLDATHRYVDNVMVHRQFFVPVS